MKKSAGITAADFLGMGVLLGGLLMEFQNGRRYVGKLRKPHLEGQISEDNCQCAVLYETYMRYMSELMRRTVLIYEFIWLYSDILSKML